MVNVTPARFGRLVEDALDALPDALAELVDNVVVIVDDVGPDPDLFGLYEGIPLTERGDYGSFELPDRIFVYRLPICAACEDEQEVIEEVQVTVIHEIAHHFGIDDERLAELGWD